MNVEASELLSFRRYSVHRLCTVSAEPWFTSKTHKCSGKKKKGERNSHEIAPLGGCGLLSRLGCFCHRDLHRRDVSHLSFFAQLLGSDGDFLHVKLAFEESSSAHFNDINCCRYGSPSRFDCNITAAAGELHQDRCNIRHDRLLSNEDGARGDSTLLARRGWRNFRLFCHILVTTFCFCYTLDRTNGPNPLYTPMDSVTTHLSLLRTAKSALGRHRRPAKGLAFNVI